MFGLGSKPTTHIDILIGKTARVHGDLDFSGGLHLDGRVIGNVRADAGSESTLSVSEAGYIEGSVEAANVVLNGTVRGHIHATGRVVLGAKARVQGDVYYGVIEIAMGAEISGKLVPVTPPQAEAAPQVAAKESAVA